MTISKKGVYRVAVTRRGVVYRAEAGSPTQSAAFPNVCVLPDGRWLCAFRAAPTKSATTGQHVLLTWSDDEGGTWRQPFDPFKPMTIDGRPGLIRAATLTSLGGGRVVAALGWVDHSDPALPFYNEQTEGLLDMRILLSHSRDAGQTWTPPQLASMPNYHCPTPITGPVLPLPDGRWLLSFEVNKPYDDLTPWVHESVVAESNDQGRTWNRCHVITRDPTGRHAYWDQRLAVLPDGRLFDVFWSFDRHAAVYLNIHARQSRDGGATWSELWDTGVPGQPAPVHVLSDGTLAMVYVDRTTSPAIKVRMSHDGGRTWPQETETMIYDSAANTQTVGKSSMNDAWSEMAAFSVGLPHTTPLKDDNALVVYYAGQLTDHTAIEWAVLEQVGPTSISASA